MSKKNKNIYDNQLYIITGKAIPDVLTLVLKCKDLVNNNNLSVADATKQIGISRTTYYKYCNEIFYYNENSVNKVYKIDILNKDQVGILSKITDAISKNKFNILTIYQNSPIKGISKISATILMTTDKCSITKLIDSIEKIPSVKEVKYKTIEKD